MWLDYTGRERPVVTSEKSNVMRAFKKALGKIYSRRVSSVPPLDLSVEVTITQIALTESNK